MATSTYPTMTGAIGKTEAAVFIPELWSDEIVAAYKKNLVLANLVNKMSMVGKKGDTLHIPKPLVALRMSRQKTLLSPFRTLLKLTLKFPSTSTTNTHV